MTLRTLHLFAGLGGSHYTAMLTGWRGGVGSIELDKWRLRELAKHFPDEPLHGDIETYDASALRGEVDLVVGGSPCQNFSNSGNRKGLAGDESRLLWNQLEVTRITQTPFMFWENVDGSLTSNDGRDWATFMGALDEMGMRRVFLVLSAEDVGAPHRRARAWLLAWRPGAEEALAPWADGYPMRGRPTGVTPSEEEVAWANLMVSGPAAQLAQEWGSEWPALSGKWPAAPGMPQARWEPPRWVERVHSPYVAALGDAWVPQCAAAAWMILCARALHAPRKNATRLGWNTPTASDGQKVRGGENQDSVWKDLRQLPGGQAAYARGERLNPLFVAALMGWPTIKRDLVLRGKVVTQGAPPRAHRLPRAPEPPAYVPRDYAAPTPQSYVPQDYAAGSQEMARMLAMMPKKRR